MQQGGNFTELVDPKLGGEVNQEEAERMIKVALLCTSASPSLRPTMSEAVSMLEGRTSLPDVIPEMSSYTDDLRFKATRDFYQEKQNAGTQTQSSTTFRTEIDSSDASVDDLYQNTLDSKSC